MDGYVILVVYLVKTSSIMFFFKFFKKKKNPPLKLSNFFLCTIVFENLLFERLYLVRIFVA